MLLPRWTFVSLLVSCFALLLVAPRQAAGWFVALVLAGLYAASLQMRFAMEEHEGVLEAERKASKQQWEGLVQLLSPLDAEEEEELQQEEGEKELRERVIAGIQAMERRTEAVVNEKELQIAQLVEALAAARKKVEAAATALAQERAGWEQM